MTEIMSQTEYLKLQRQLESLRTEIARAQGKKQLLAKQMLEKWGCDSIQAAQTMLSELKDKLTHLQQQCRELDAEIRKEFMT